jgi:hypothetical protein
LPPLSARVASSCSLLLIGVRLHKIPSGINFTPLTLSLCRSYPLSLTPSPKGVRRYEEVIIIKI